MSALLNRVRSLMDDYEAEFGEGAVWVEVGNWVLGAIAFAAIVLDILLLGPLLAGGGQ